MTTALGTADVLPRIMIDMLSVSDVSDEFNMFDNLHVDHELPLGLGEPRPIGAPAEGRAGASPVFVEPTIGPGRRPTSFSAPARRGP